MVDDSHAVGFRRPHWPRDPRAARRHRPRRHRHRTLGKALGGASGFVAAAQPIVDLLRQRARPYLFDLLAPPIAAGALKALMTVRVMRLG